jgi:fibronectin-binding autotransporter adhesin
MRAAMQWFNRNCYSTSSDAGKAATRALRQTARRCAAILVAFVAVAAVCASSALADPGTWISTTSTNWGEPSSWSGGVVASGTGTTADFSTVDLTADVTVTLEQPYTEGNLVFGDTDTTTPANWIITGANTLTLVTTSPAIPTITVNALGTGATAIINSALAGTNGLMKSGSGTLILGVANSFTGGTTIAGGTLQLGVSGAIPANSGSITFNNGTLSVPTGSYTNVLNVTPGQTANYIARGSVTIGSLTATIASGSGTINFTINGGSQLTMQGNWSGFSGTINAASSSTTLSSIRINPNSGNFTAAGLTNTAVNLTSNVQLETKTSSTVNTITIGALSGDSTSILGGGDNSGGGQVIYSVGGLGTSTTFAGQILDFIGTANGGLNTGGGHVAITKTGAGTLVLSNPTMIYAGPTAISGGVLQIDGTKSSNASGATVTVNNLGTLAGSGSIAGAVNVKSGGHLAPGTTTSVGTITFNGTGAALTLAAGAQLDTEFRTNSDSTVVNDLVNVTTSNGLAINGGTFNLFNEGSTAAFSTNGTYNLIQYAGTITGTGTSALAVGNQQPGKSYLFGTFNNFVTLSISNGGNPSFWNKSTGDTWNLAANWTTGGPPDAVAAFAAFGGGGTALTGPATVTLDGSRTTGTLSFNSTQPFTIAQGTGSGTLNLDGGANAGSVTVSNGSHAVTAPLAISANGATVFVVNAADTITFGGALSGPAGASGGGAINKLGAGTLAITAANPLFTGSITSSNGTVLLNNANGLSAGALGATTPGTVTFGSGIGTFNLAKFTGGTIALADTAAQPVTLSIGAGDGSSTAQGGVSGAGSIIKVGAGTLTIAGTNTYTGGTTINGGIISLADVATPFGAGPIAFNNGTRIIDAAASGNAWTNAISIPTGAEVTLSFNNNSRFDSPITGDATTIIDISNDNSTRLPELRGNNTSFFGTFNLINSSAVRIAATNNANGAGGDSSKWHLAAGSRLAISSTGTTTVHLGELSGDATSILQGFNGGSGAPAQTWQIGALNTDSTFAGTIVDGQGSSNTTNKTNIIKVGSGTLKLTGNSTTSGSVTVSGGAVQIGDGGTTGSIVGPLVIDDPGTVTFNRSDNLTFAGLINITQLAQGTGILNKNGAGILTLSNANSLTPTLNVNQGTLALGASLETVSLSLAPGAKLDVGASTFYDILDSASTLRALLKKGFNQGNWDGSGGIGTSLTSSAGYLTGVGSGMLTDPAFPGFGAVPAAKYTYYGDTDLNGIVDATDFGNFLDGLAGGGNTWAQGDFTYDDKIDLGNDFNLFLAGYLHGGAALGDLAPIIAGDTNLSSTQKAQLLSLVPEPASAGMLVAAACVFATKRSRRRS